MTTRAVVVGAGPAGLGAALGLASWCDTVTVLDAGRRDRLRRVGEHLPPAGLAKLAALGLGDLLEDRRHEVSPGVRSAWGNSHFADKEYFASVPGWGLNLCREQFDRSLAQRAERLGVTVRFQTRLTDLVRNADGFAASVLSTNGAERVDFDVVVDASGRRAAAARQLGAKRHRSDRLVGLLGRVTGCGPIDEPGRVHVESVEDGWWYGIRMLDGTLLATFMTDTTLVRRYPGDARALWQERLRESTLLAPLAATGHWDGRLSAFDAATQFVEFDAPENFLSVGDAAAAYDPLSSWGITKGLCDGTNGAAALARARTGSPSALVAHRERQREEFQDHRSTQHDYYCAETRWPESPFWRTRQQSRQLQAS